jgi:hypothetical protein
VGSGSATFNTTTAMFAKEGTQNAHVEKVNSLETKSLLTNK